MADVDLAGVIEGGSQATGVLFTSTLGTNTPQPSSGNVVAYTDPTAPAGGAYPGVDDDMPNSGVTLQPFLRAFMPTSLPSFGYEGEVSVGFTYPEDSVAGDLAILVMTSMVNSSSTPDGLTVPNGWTQIYKSSTGGTRVWVHYLTDGEPGQQVTSFASLYSGGVALAGVWGNAQFAQILNNADYNTRTVTAPGITIPGGDAGVFFYLAQKSYNSGNVYNPTWTPSSILAHVETFTAPMGYYTVPVVADYYPVQDSLVAPEITAANGGTGWTLTGTSNFAIWLRGITVFPYATVNVEERTGDNTSSDIEQFVHLMARDMHSPQIAYGYAEGAMNDTGSGVLYTYERWIRIRFDPKFNTVKGFRFWAPNMTALPDGWTVNYGTATEFQTPANTESSIAVTPVPTSDPGSASPNAGGEARLAGTGTQYSDWIVLQASVDTAVVGPGPVLGFSTEGTLIPIEFCFVWTET